MSVLTPESFINSLPAERKEAMSKLRQIIAKNLPKGFEERMSGNMIAYEVPLSTYPDGYHCTPDTPLPFLSIANQKNFIALYHFGMYVDEELMAWWTSEFPKHAKRKLNMGKSCIRFKYLDDIPFDLIGKLVQKVDVKQWIATYESKLLKK